MKIIKTANFITTDDKKRVLLIKRAYNQEDPNLWSLPGGTKEDSETLEGCLIREIKEELNSSIKKYYFFQSYTVKNDNKTVIANYYVGSINDSIKLNKQESSEYKWFAQKEIPSNLAYNQNNVLSDFFNSTFYYTFYSYQKVISDLGKKLSKILDLKRLSSLIVDTLMKTMQLDRTVILMREENGYYTILRNIGFKEENGISLVKDNFLTKYLEKTKKPLVYEDLFLAQKETALKKEKENLEKFQENMKKIEANLCLPLFREDKIIGIIVLGKKISGDPYSQEDLEFLIALSTQASIALENARLYSEIEDLSQNLQEKVNQQTKELKEAYQIEKKAYQELKKLDEAKTQFIMATQHHLRTPLTIMKGYVSMLLEGDYGKINQKAKEKLFFFQQSTEKLINLVNDFLDISQFRVGKGVLKLEKVKVKDLVNEIIKELKSEAESKGIYLKLEKLDPLPFIQADPRKLKEAIYNIVDNGVKYTEKGGITINIKEQGTKNEKTLLIEIEDTGIGIEREEINTLFKETFERSKGAKRLYALGRGIGLYIASNIIKAHRGKIWAESLGKGKGSMFYIELPIK